MNHLWFLQNDDEMLVFLLDYRQGSVSALQQSCKVLRFGLYWRTHSGGTLNPFLCSSSEILGYKIKFRIALKIWQLNVLV